MSNTASSSPVTTLGLAPSFGFGDRMGLATPGHVTAMRQKGAGILPIFAQQSIREMTRTNRTAQQVMDDALRGAKSAGYTGPQGADADHLKTTEDVDRTAAAGFTFFTIDPSAEVDAKADDYSSDELAAKFRAVQTEVDWVGNYEGKKIRVLPATTIDLTKPVVAKAAVKYGRAINLAVRLANHIRSVMNENGADHEIELSVDETPQPTTLAEHYIIAEQCVKHGMKLVSLAPRFIGDFEKGVDYKGNLVELERSLAEHAAIATMLGGYKLSLHSGSDKISIYALLARQTHGRFHVKTAGTSYLEALRVAARHDVKLFRAIVDFSRSRYDQDKATYHVSATLADAPESSRISDAGQLEKTYLGNWADAAPGTGLSDPGRQILHCTFGSVLTHKEFGPALRHLLELHADTYHDVLAFHFGKHLEALKAGM
ncbi:MAG TPA: tagaturonate epimerase family protein [Humisphaera sp.]|jgi:hypothetical protein|nr:tagaturonate epimerase family protein [Humisphaera sp.]